MLANQNQMGYNPLESILSNRSYNSQQNTNNMQGLDMPSITEMLRSQGRDGDTILAHINPEEAEMLKQMGGSGTINPNTGLPEFRFMPGIFNRKVFNLKNALSVVGTIIGNTILPGVGGIIGGSLGSMGGTALDKGFKITPGKPNYLNSAASGAAIGALLPSASSLGGSVASKLGFTNAGTALTNYGNANSVSAALGLNDGKGYTGPIDFLTNAGKTTEAAKSAVAEVAKDTATKAAEKGFLDKLTSDPMNLMMAGSLASYFLSKQSPEQMGREQKRYQQAMQLTPAEEKAKLERELQYYEMKKQKEREEKRKNREDWEGSRNVNTNALIGGLGGMVINSPEAYAQTGRWIEHRYAKGGIVEMLKKKEPAVKQTVTRILIPLNVNGFGGFEDFEDDDKDKAKKFATGKFLDGDTHGQDDKIHALLSDGEYVVNASRVADLGDGNNKAGAKFLDSFLKNIAKYKTQHPNKKIPPSLLNKKISYFVNQ
jgi:hypothetical protein